MNAGLKVTSAVLTMVLIPSVYALRAAEKEAKGACCGVAAIAAVAKEQCVSTGAVKVVAAEVAQTNKVKKVVPPPAKVVPPPAPEPGVFVGGGATIRLGMTHAEALAQVSPREGVQWFSADIDSVPTPELLKMDEWNIMYNRPAGPESGYVKLRFDNGKVVSVESSNNQ